MRPSEFSERSWLKSVEDEALERCGDELWEKSGAAQVGWLAGDGASRGSLRMRKTMMLPYAHSRGHSEQPFMSFGSHKSDILDTLYQHTDANMRRLYKDGIESNISVCLR